MFRSGLDNPRSFRLFFNCFLFSFLAGNVNVGGLLSCGRFVTHVTGFATLFGIDMAEHAWRAALGILSVPLYFLIGTMISAFFIDRRIHKNKPPRYALVMGLIACCLLGVSVAGSYDFFGAFGGTVNLTQDYLLLAILCGASGLQNAAITTSSGAALRTTHLTGITTDLGIGLVRLFTCRKNHEQRTREWHVNELRLTTLLGFMLGSWIGACLFLNFHYLGFLLPAALAGYAMLAMRPAR